MKIDVDFFSLCQHGNVCWLDGPDIIFLTTDKHFIDIKFYPISRWFLRPTFAHLTSRRGQDGFRLTFPTFSIVVLEKEALKGRFVSYSNYRDDNFRFDKSKRVKQCLK